MPIKFFDSIIPEDTALKDLEDQFNAFEYREAESIQKVYLTSFTIPENNNEPRVILWCQYRSKRSTNSNSSTNTTSRRRSSSLRPKTSRVKRR